MSKQNKAAGKAAEQPQHEDDNIAHGEPDKKPTRSAYEMLASLSASSEILPPGLRAIVGFGNKPEMEALRSRLPKFAGLGIADGARPALQLPSVLKSAANPNPNPNSMRDIGALCESLKTPKPSQIENKFSLPVVPIKVTHSKQHPEARYHWTTQEGVALTSLYDALLKQMCSTALPAAHGARWLLASIEGCTVYKGRDSEYAVQLPGDEGDRLIRSLQSAADPWCEDELLRLCKGYAVQSRFIAAQPVEPIAPKAAIAPPVDTTSAECPAQDSQPHEAHEFSTSKPSSDDRDKTALYTGDLANAFDGVLGRSAEWWDQYIRKKPGARLLQGVKTAHGRTGNRGTAARWCPLTLAKNILTQKSRTPMLVRQLDVAFSKPPLKRLRSNWTALVDDPLYGG